MDIVIRAAVASTRTHINPDDAAKPKEKLWDAYMERACATHSSATSGASTSQQIPAAGNLSHVHPVIVFRFVWTESAGGVWGDLWPGILNSHCATKRANIKPN